MSRPKHNEMLAKPLADVVGKAIEPACRRRGLATAGLVTYWSEIVGDYYAPVTRPEKINWPRQTSAVDEGAEPATIVIRVETSHALALQHDWPRIRERLNVYFGFLAIGRVKIVQGTVAKTDGDRVPVKRALDDGERSALAAHVADIGDPELKSSLQRLGEAVFSEEADESRRNTNR